MQLILDSNGLIVKKKNQCFFIKNKNTQRLISPIKINSIVVSKDVLFSASALRLALKHDIPLIIFNPYGGVAGRLWKSGYHSHAAIRRKQMELAGTTTGLNIVKHWFMLKTVRQEANLNWLKNRLPSKVDNIDSSIFRMQKASNNLKTDLSSEEIFSSEMRSEFMGQEGIISKYYWHAIGASLSQPFAFKARSRRPAQDAFNAGLNYLYSMLYAQVETAAIAAGLDLHFGLLHADQAGKPTLVYDLIEPFRPFIDRIWIEMCLRKTIKNHMFNGLTLGVSLNKSGKKIIIPAFYDFMEKRKVFLNKGLKMKDHINVFAGNFAKQLISE